MINNVELLAPAGSKDSFYAAINSGADAVYLGGKNFSARQYSENFSNEELAEIIKYAHNKNCKVYVTVNTILKDTEIIDALNYIFYLYEINVDAVIVQDLGLVYLINKYLPDFNVNISTQATIYDKYGVEFFDYSNINKFILSRELSLDQIKEVVNSTDIDIETFIHGALCMCYSGQCYFSSFLGGRSGNRGKCAQPCRLNYSFFNEKNKSTVEKFSDKPLLSLKDFKVGDFLYKLIDAGVKTLKIEGRMKTPEYTAIVVEYYRQLLDNYIKNTEYDLSIMEKKVESVFSRGFTNGYLNNGKDDMFAGVSTGSKGSDIDDIIDEIREKTNPYSICRRNNVDLSVEIKIGNKIKLIARDDINESVVYSEEVVEESIKNPVTKEIVEEQLNKLGNTVFKLNNLNIEIDENAFARKSTLNQLRRDAVDKLLELKANIYSRKIVDLVTKYELFNKVDKEKIKPKISFKINSIDDIKFIDNTKIGRIYVPFNLDLSGIKDIQNIEKYLYIPNIVNKDIYDYLANNLKSYEGIFDGVCVNNIGTYSFFQKHSKLKIHCGYFFNIINSYNAIALQKKGTDSITFSVEANIKDIESISEYTDMKTELVSYAYIQLMTMKNCPFSVLKGCKSSGNCNTCEYRTGYKLKDRINVNFNVERENKLSLLYNSVPLTTIGKTSEFLDFNINYYFVDSKWAEDIKSVIDVLYKENIELKERVKRLEDLIK